MHTFHRYVHDPEQRREEASSRDLDTRCVDGIRHTLANINPFARGLRQLGQEPAEDISLHVEWKDESSEIGAIIHRGDSSGGPRTVVFWKRSELAPTFISPLDRLYEPLQYPLFFPHGCCGWFPGLTSTHPPYQRVTQLEYYRQRLLTEPRFGLLGRLLNEDLVDMFSSVEDNRLYYVRQHVQSRIAARRELDETIEAEGGARAGRVYLPASFMGSPRMQRRLIADRLAVVRRLGKPTYFITVTCNPNWPEIRNHPELHRQNASDRPDLTCRIFRAKLTHLVDALRRGLLGRKVYLMYVVEFQKRGLPHAHLALWVTPQPQTSDDIDDIVSAEVPPCFPKQMTNAIENSCLGTWYTITRRRVETTRVDVERSFRSPLWTEHTQTTEDTYTTVGEVQRTLTSCHTIDICCCSVTATSTWRYRAPSTSSCTSTSTSSRGLIGHGTKSVT